MANECILDKIKKIYVEKKKKHTVEKEVHKI